MTIGIPRGLIYWKRPQFWGKFFRELGFKVVLSPATNREIAENGIKMSDPETCFANKIFWGHLLWLDEKIAEDSSRLPPRAASRRSVCDCIFIPRLKTNEDKLEYCPKFFGIPDVAKIIVKTPILTETFDEKKRRFKISLEKLGAKLKKGKKEVAKAANAAFKEEEQLKEKDRKDFLETIRSEKPKIILISHPYNLYDDYVNLKIKEKLIKLGVEVIFIDQVPLQQGETQFVSLAGSAVKGFFPERQNSKFIDWPQFHWEFGKEMMEKSDKVMSYNIAGVIQISSFQCGCDAVLKEFIQKKFKDYDPSVLPFSRFPKEGRAHNKIPFLYLIIDEHTGEAGLQTRLEAFVDTLRR